MGMPIHDYYSADMVRALPDDGNIYEVVHGELLVTPTPRLWHAGDPECGGKHLATPYSSLLAVNVIDERGNELVVVKPLI
jgi:hypothetical protein